MSGLRSSVDTTTGAAVERPTSGVSWAAILAGGLVALVTTLVLLLIGAGIGLTQVSPWGGDGATVSTLAIGTAIWLIVTQWISSGLGGYVAGRLRTPWTGGRRDEVLFRDTAHGLLTWALATIVGVTLLGSAAGTIVGAGARGVAAVSGGVAEVVGPVSAYQLDTLLRPAQTGAGAPDAARPDVAPEITRILANGLQTGEVPPEDRTYLAQLVSTRAGIPEEDARRRVDQTIDRARQAATEARQAAETARQTTMRVALFGALAMVIGAFVAAVAGAYGGQLRDDPS